MTSYSLTAQCGWPSAACRQCRPWDWFSFSFSSTGRVPPPFGLGRRSRSKTLAPLPLDFLIRRNSTPYISLHPSWWAIRAASTGRSHLTVSTARRESCRPNNFQIVRLITGSYQSFLRCLECVFLLLLIFPPPLIVRWAEYTVDACGTILPSWNSFDGLVGSNHRVHISSVVCDRSFPRCPWPNNSSGVKRKITI